MTGIFRAACLSAICLTAPTAFGVSAGYWQYDGEFATTNTAGAARNRPMFLDINAQGELVYGHLGSGTATSTNELYAVGNIFAGATSGVIPVSQVKLNHSLSSDNSTLRGISGVACQPGTGHVYVCSDAGVNKREIQVLTRTGALAYTGGSTMSLSNQSRVHGLAFSPVNANVLVAGEIDTTSVTSYFNVYDVAPGTTFTLLGKVSIPKLGTGVYVRDVAVDTNDTVWINMNGTIIKMPGGGLSIPATVATYTSGSASRIHDPGANNDINPMGISWSNVTDEPIIVANGGNNPSADPRLHRVWNATNGAPVLQYTDGFTSNALRAAASPNGEFGNSCDSKAVMGPSSVPYLFVSETVKGRIVRFKAAIPPTSAKEWDTFE